RPVPRRLLLLSAEASAEALLSEHLRSDADAAFLVHRVCDVQDLEAAHSEQECHAVLLDMRTDRDVLFGVISRLAELRAPLAVMCLVQNSHQLRECTEVLDMVDGYVLLDSMGEGEL